jgi:fatty acid desaturase
LEKDAEIHGRGAYTLWSYCLYMIGPGYWIGMLKEMVRHALGSANEAHYSEKNQKLVVFEARMYLLGYGLIAFGSWYYGTMIVVYYWLAPLLLLKGMHQVENVTEHTGMPHIKGILKNTRSIDTVWVLRWLCWQMPYHTAHHTYPAVPFWKLKTLHKEIFTDKGIEPETIGYLSFQWNMFKKLLKEGHSAYSGKKIEDY